MMINVFTVNKNDKIEFTKNELEKLLNEVWEDGRRDGLNFNKNYWWTSPTIATTTNPCIVTTQHSSDEHDIIDSGKFRF